MDGRPRIEIGARPGVIVCYNHVTAVRKSVLKITAKCRHGMSMQLGNQMQTNRYIMENDL